MPISAANGRWVDETTLESQRTYALFTHLAGLISLADMTLGGPIATVIMWRVKAHESEFLDDHGREAMNFQLSMLIYTLAGSAIIAIVTFGIGVLPWIVLMAVMRLVGCIRGAMAASRGEYYRYPVCIRFLKPSPPM